MYNSLIIDLISTSISITIIVNMRILIVILMISTLAATSCTNLIQTS